MKTIFILLFTLTSCSQISNSVYQITIETVNGKSQISIDGKPPVDSPVTTSLTRGKHRIVLSRNKFDDQSIELSVEKSGPVFLRHQRKQFVNSAIKLNYLGVFKCGKQPKQVDFSPDGKYLFIPLLDDEGFHIFDLREKTILTMIKPEAQYAKRGGFVEGLFIEKNKTFLVSQMTTHSVFEYDISDMNNIRLKRIFDTYGKYPKVVIYSPRLNVITVSNWITNDVITINYADGTKLNRITDIPVPRGLAYSRDGKYLYLASFDGGLLLKYSTASWKEVARIYKPRAAMRHIILSPDGSKIYLSNMMDSEVYEIDEASFKIIHTWHVFDKPNTIEITPNGKYLFVSNRGPNNRGGFMLKSPDIGKVQIIDVTSKEIIETIDGGLQPTGLDISPDGHMLAFSNFQDDTIELYELKY